jgi:hypothetical protein
MKISDLELRAKLWWLLAHLLSFAELLTGLFSTYCIGVSVAGRSNIFLGVIVGIVVCTVTVAIFWFFRMMVSTSMTVLWTTEVLSMPYITADVMRQECRK